MESDNLNVKNESKKIHLSPLNAIALDYDSDYSDFETDKSDTVEKIGESAMHKPLGEAITLCSEIPLTNSFYLLGKTHANNDSEQKQMETTEVTENLKDVEMISEKNNLDNEIQNAPKETVITQQQNQLIPKATESSENCTVCEKNASAHKIKLVNPPCETSNNVDYPTELRTKRATEIQPSDSSDSESDSSSSDSDIAMPPDKNLETHIQMASTTKSKQLNIQKELETGASKNLEDSEKDIKTAVKESVINQQQNTEIEENKNLEDVVMVFEKNANAEMIELTKQTNSKTSDNTVSLTEYRSNLTSEIQLSDSSDSDSDSSTSGSSNSSTKQGLVNVSSESSDDEHENGKSIKKPKKKNPIFKGEFDDLPPIEKLEISVPEVLCDILGEVAWIVEQMVVVKPKPGTPTLNFDTVLFIERGKRALGQIFDVFGQVSDPHYCVRFNSADHIRECNIKEGMRVYYCPNSQYTSVVFLSELTKIKAVDDLGEEDHPQFSDDEEERAYYASLKTKSNNPNNSTPTAHQNKGKKSAKKRPWNANNPWSSSNHKQHNSMDQNAYAQYSYSYHPQMYYQQNYYPNYNYNYNHMYSQSRRYNQYNHYNASFNYENPYGWNNQQIESEVMETTTQQQVQTNESKNDPVPDQKTFH